jgi:ParB-like nuclease domain
MAEPYLNIYNTYIWIYYCDVWHSFITLSNFTGANKPIIMQALVTKDEMLRVPFSRMRLDPDNERIDLGPIDWLIDNIRNEGVKEPLWGYRGIDENRKECYFVVNGSRRFAALKVLTLYFCERKSP